ncbi:hypothetical protein O1611_g6138 [Lasiodiplodia mahajangana]|uniref:Uncharacterized protein n=1 Tax=Lasiodiplodia mahajangana TaxID=1108764 RepID=A0ACC2JJN4_9PEZI|nr:hypothetical protein O1611_g6138 [Lasiodiplodia mahajangana]
MLKAHSANVNQVPQDLTGGGFECAKGIKCAPIFRVLMLEKPRARSSRSRQPTSCETFNNDLQRIQGVRLRQLVALLENGADPNQRYDRDFVTPIFFLLTSLGTYMPSFYFESWLMLSDEAEHQTNLVNEIVVDFLDTLRDFGADISRLGNIYYYKEHLARSIFAAYPETPLHAACRLNDRHKPIIHWFLRNGVSINSLGRAESTPLMAYCGSKFTNLDQFRQFLRCKPLINHQDILGRTALHDLCDNYGLQPQVMEKAVRMMLDRGANPTLLNNEGRAPGQGIESTARRITPYEDVLLMLQDGCKKWEKWKQKTERRALSELRSGTKDGCADHLRSRRQDAEGVCDKDQQENQEDDHGNRDKQISCNTGEAVGTRGRPRTMASGSHRTNRGGYRRGTQSSTRRSTRNCDRNHTDGQRNGRQDAVPESSNNIPLEDSWGVPQNNFYDQICGGRYSGGSRRDDRGASRSGKRSSRSHSRGYRGDINREYRGSHRGSSRGAYHQNCRDTGLVEVPRWDSTENKPPVGHR